MDANLWKIESLRLTNFVDNQFNSNNLEKWLINITGELPLQINKSLSNFSGLSKLEESVVKLEWRQNRIDLIENSDAPNIKNNIGDFSHFSELCEMRILRYFQMEDCPVIDRLALGVVLYLPVVSNEEGIRIIAPLLKSVIGIENSEDFQLRINRPVRLEIAGGIKVNRLLTWTIGHVQLLQLQINIQTGIAQSTPLSMQSEMQLRLEIDLSTDAKPGRKILLEQQKEVVNYFIDTVKKVAESGEHGLYV
ncbi:MAG: hypothetical protein Q8O28_13960 [Smithellaceae bacterium]|nr:hypothetical protein [Smithellaceae bacterium]